VLLRRMGEAVVTDDYPKEILQATLGADYRALAQLKG
jgi:3-dehydroquinate synthase